MLEKADGPACVKCGCTAAELVGTRTFRGVVSDRWQCEFCGHEFYKIDAKQAEETVFVEPDQTIVYVTRLRCPIENCRSPRIWCYGTVRAPAVAGRRTGPTVRYHRCLVCDHRFKSEERHDENET